MPLQDQVLSISFAKGLNTKVDPKQIMPGELLVLQNGTFIAPEEITTDWGSSVLTQDLYNSASTISNGNSIFVFNNQLVMSDGSYLYRYSETEQLWVQSGIKVANSLMSSSIGSNQNSTTTDIGFCASTSGIECYTWASGGVDFFYISLYDPNNQVILYQATVATANFPNQFNNVIFGTTFYALVVAGDTLYYYPITIATPGTGTLTTLLTLNASSPYDVVQTATNFFILYGDSAGDTVLSKYTSAFTLVNSVTLESTTHPQVLALVTSTITNDLYPIWYDGTNNYMAIYDENLNVVTAKTTLSATFVPPVRFTGVVQSTNVFHLFVQFIDHGNSFNSTVVYAIREYIVPIPILTTSLGSPLYNVQIFSRAYLFNSYAYLDIYFYERNGKGPIPFDQILFCGVQFTSPTSYNIVTKYAEGDAAGGGFNGEISKPIQVNVANLQLTIPYPLIISDTESAIANVARLQVSLGSKIKGVNLGNNLNLSGAILSNYDGLGVAENGFTVFPSNLNNTATAGTGGNLPNGTYSYVALYEWIDNEGNLMRSSPSLPVSVTLSGGGSTQTISMQVDGTSLSEPYKIANINISWWRTVNGGTIYFLVASGAQVMPVGLNGITEGTSDTELQNNPQLYTTGGEVPNIAPPATMLMTSFKNRLIAVESDSPFEWWYSKQNITGFPAEFSDFFTQNIDEIGGPISAVTYMDYNLIFFKTSNIFFVNGEGPSPSGANNDFTYPQILTSDVGCQNQSSLVTIPIGTIFQSTDKGIFLLDRSLQVSYIGAQVEEFNAFTVTSAVLLPNTTQVRFTLNTGTILIYDYLVNQWSTHTGLTFVDSVIYNEKQVALQANGEVFEFTPGLYQDNTSPVALSLTTGWFSFAQKQGFQRVKQFQILLTAQNATSIRVTMYYDFNPSFLSNTVIIPITATTIPQKYRIFPQFQKCTSMQVQIVEIPTGAEGGGLTISGLSFNLGIKKGLSKLPVAQSFGGNDAS